LAVQIAAEISKTDRVLYYDFEQSAKQFQMRYTDPKTNKLYKFPKNFIRLTLPTESLNAMGANMEETIMAHIEGDVNGYKAKILIIDNISWLMNARNSTETASNLMKRLVALKRIYGLSILVLAHTKKKAATKPIDQNDLAGSKRLINFFDAAFSIGKSMDDPYIKYLKQIKVRTGQFLYDSDHVMLCSIEQKDSLVQFVPQGFGDEADHLKKPKAQEKMIQMASVRSLKATGKSVREIAEITGISKSKVDRLLKS
jgi:predicted ATP-dependent serine protease